MDCSTIGSSVLHCLLEFAHTHVHWVDDAIQPSHPVTHFSYSQSFPASPGVCLNSYQLSQQCYLTILSYTIPLLLLLQHQGFSNESALCIRCSKCWSFSFSNSLSNKYSELISFRIDWFDLLAVQGTRKGIFQDHSSKASVLQCSTFFIFLLLHPYMTIGKTIALLCITAPKSAVELGARLILALSPCLFGSWADWRLREDDLSWDNEGLFQISSSSNLAQPVYMWNRIPGGRKVHSAS